MQRLGVVFPWVRRTGQLLNALFTFPASSPWVGLEWEVQTRMGQLWQEIYSRVFADKSRSF